MKNLSFCLLALALVGTLAGGSLFAYFTDTETSTGNTLHIVGGMDLWVNGQTQWSERFDLDLKPCEWHRWEDDALFNSGPVDAVLSLHLKVYDWRGGDFPEPEQSVDPDNSCDLQDYLEVMVLADPVGDALPYLKGTAGGYTTPAADIHEAIARLTAQGMGSYIKYSGLLKDFHCSWKTFGDLLGNTTRNIQLFVHLRDRPDANVMQGDAVTVDKTFLLEQLKCGTGPGGGGKTQLLPNYPVSATLVYNGWWPRVNTYKSYWTVTFTGIGSNTYAVQNGVEYNAWCLDRLQSIGSGTTWQVTLMSSLNPMIYSYDPDWASPDEFNYCNYLINRYDQAQGGEGDLQRALWYFIDGVSWAWLAPYPGAQAMVNDALLNGGTFVPEPGQLALVVLFDGVHFQISAIEVDP